MKLGSLFSGTGALDMAVANVTGATTAWVSDIDKGANKILAHRYPDVPNLADISTVDWSQVEPVDILTGGFPCQDVSHAGKRAGLRPNTRTGLWTQMAYAIDQLRPRLVVAENVRGLLSAEAHSDVEPCPWCVGDRPGGYLRALGAVLGDLADLGYDASWFGFPAGSDNPDEFNIGACHRRFRIFLVAYSRGEAGELGGGLRTDEQAGHGWGQSARDGGPLLPTPDTGESISGHGRRGGKSGNGHQSGVSLEHALLPTPRASDGPDDSSHGRSWSTTDRNLHTLVHTGELLPTPTVQDGSNNAGPSQFDRNTPPLNTVVMMLPTPSVAQADGGQTSRSGNRKDELLLGGIAADAETFGQFDSSVNHWANIIGRPAPPPTEPTGKNGAHRLSPRFVEHMMGLPDGWVTDVPNLSRNEQLKALGNGVVPQQAEAALRMLLPMAVAA